MREYFKISAATPQSAFLKANNPLCGNWPVEIKESPLWKFKFWLYWGLEDLEEGAARKYQAGKYWTVNSGVAPTRFDGGVDIEEETRNGFGRGQPVSSVSTGWYPKPIQYKLLGGAVGKKKKMGPTKAKKSQDGNYILMKL